MPIAVLTGADLQALGPRSCRADFHCVTTWSVVGLTWTGVPLREVLVAAGAPQTPYLVARSGDRRKTAFLWEDAVAEDVIVATHLDGKPLDDRHGAPLRLVSPSQYGYKSAKHLVSIDLRAEEPRPLSKQHLRARVAVEERHPTLPNWLIRWPYRMLIPATAHLAERTLARHRSSPR